MTIILIITSEIPNAKKCCSFPLIIFLATLASLACRRPATCAGSPGVKIHTSTAIFTKRRLVTMHHYKQRICCIHNAKLKQVHGTTVFGPFTIQQQETTGYIDVWDTDNNKEALIKWTFWDTAPYIKLRLMCCSEPMFIIRMGNQTLT